MALIKCPECGKDVSTEASCCPHCGYPIHKIENKKEENISVEENKMLQSIEKVNRQDTTDLIEKYKREKIVSIICYFLFGSAFLAIGISLAIGFTDAIGLYMASYFLIGIGVGLILISFVAIFMYRIVKQKMDGYDVVVYAGFSKRLAIDGKEVACIYFNRYLYGKLPNGNSICATISAWDNAVKLEYVSNGSDHRIE